jgi:hypothetical protein
MYLRRFDAVLLDFSKATSGWLRKFFRGDPFTRWMDDIWAFGTDEGRLRSLQLTLQEVAREAGVELSSAKTRIVEGDDLAADALRVEHSAVDDALTDEPVNLTPLEELVDALLLSPQTADRTSIRFATSRMRRQKAEGRVDLLLDVADRMPQGADHLARLARDFGRWREREAWFLEYVGSDWACIEWSVAQLGTMVPCRTRPSPELVAHFEGQLQLPRNLATSALVTQRLSSWDKDRARDLFRAVLDTFSAPLERRLLALAAHAAGEERTWIRRALSEYEENAVVLQMLEESSWAPVKAIADFSASEEE